MPMTRLNKYFSTARQASLHGYLFVALAAFAAQICTAQTEKYENSVEEVVVTGQRSLQFIRAEVIEAESAVYDYFNELHAGTDYEIICVRERQLKNPLNPIPNSWTVRSCRSKRAHELHKQAMEDYGEYIFLEDSGLIGIPPDAYAYQARSSEHGEMLHQKVKDLLLKNKEYREKFLSYVKLKKEYETAVASDYEKGNFFTRLFKRDE